MYAGGGIYRRIVRAAESQCPSQVLQPTSFCQTGLTIDVMVFHYMDGATHPINTHSRLLASAKSYPTMSFKQGLAQSYHFFWSGCLRRPKSPKNFGYNPSCRRHSAQLRYHMSHIPSLRMPAANWYL